MVPSARGIEANLAKELGSVSTVAAAEGTKAGTALGGNVAKSLQTTLGKTSSLAAGLGVPFAAQLSTINSRFDVSSAKADGFRQTIENVGKASLIAAGVGLTAIGTSAVHAADQFEISRARLETAVKNTGGDFEDASKGVSTLDDSFVKLGFNTSDTEDALSRLTVATGSVSKATQLMAVAADIARARNIPLVQSTDLLAKAANGNFLGLRRLGIASKDQIASFHSLADVTDFLAKKFGGQAAAFSDTFAGKMAALKAQANQLEVTIGTGLIPRIQGLADLTVRGVQGFESFNRSTDGTAGRLALIAAATPAVIFAFTKIKDAIVAATAAEGGLSVASTGLVGALVGVAGGVALGDKLKESLAGGKVNVDALTASFKHLADSNKLDSNAVDLLGTSFGKLSGDLTTIRGNTLQKGFGFAGSAQQAVRDIGATNDALKKLIVTAGPTAAYKAFAQLAAGLERAGQNSRDIGQQFSPFLHALQQAQEDSDKTTGSLDHTGNAARQAGDAFAYMGGQIKSAADALDTINGKAFKGIQTGIARDTAQTGVQDAIDALNNPDPGSSGGGGGGETATATALDAIQKNLTLRDSQRGVQQAAQGVKDAQEQLTRAQQDQTTATQTLRSAQENYRQTLQGVSRDSKAAKDAADALAQAQNNKEGAQLSVDAAKRNLEKAKNDKGLLALAVKDARDKLAADKAGGSGSTQFVETPTGSQQVSSTGGADPEQIRKDQIALNDAIIDQKGADDTVKQAELDLKNARLAAKQSTKDAAEAQRIYNGTINGFPPASQEAKQAQDQLTQAQRGAEDAADGVRHAQDQLTTAVNATADANLALLRAQADVDGKLTASSGASSAGKKLDSLKTRTDNATTAILNLADAAGKADLAAGHSFGYAISDEIGVLRTYAAANPLLAHAFDGALADLQHQFDLYLSHQAPPPYIAPATVGTTTGPGAGNIRRRAAGGPVDPHQAYLVNENGAELLIMGDKGGTVVPNHSLRNSRPWAGGGDTYNIYASALEAHRIGQIVVESLQHVTASKGAIRNVRFAN